MTISDHFVVPNPTTQERGRVFSAADLDEADQLISDLAALIDAGLVGVCEQLGEPVRYGAVSDLADEV
jgi:hypothetical protein